MDQYKQCTKVLTVGVYDLIHSGHVNLFRKAKSYGDYLIVAVQSSEVVTKFKPETKVICDTNERMYMVNAIKWVDKVYEYQNVYDIVKSIDFDIFVVGPDQNHQGFQDSFRYCRENGKKVVVLPRTEGVSTSMIKEKIIT
jgi:glycerol-3-phosphate cytidylyltransferase